MAVGSLLRADVAPVNVRAIRMTPPRGAARVAGMADSDEWVTVFYFSSIKPRVWHRAWER